MSRHRLSRLALTGALLAGPVLAQASLLEPVISLAPGSPSFSAAANLQAPHAWTLVGDPDVWQFDLSGFAGPVKVAIQVSDWYPAWPDDYDLYWDGGFLGNTRSAVNDLTFTARGATGLHALAVDYVNKHTGWLPSVGPRVNEYSNGSFYNLSVVATPVPEPATQALALSGLALLVALVRKRQG